MSPFSQTGNAIVAHFLAMFCDGHILKNTIVGYGQKKQALMPRDSYSVTLTVRTGDRRKKRHFMRGASSDGVRALQIEAL